MKSIITKLSTLLVAGAVALVGCTDFSADLREVNDRLDNLANETAKKTEVEALKSTVESLMAQLKSQYATKEDVAAVAATVKTVQDAVNAAKAELVAALDNKADKSEIESAVAKLTATLEEAKEEIQGAIDGLKSDNESIKKSLSELLTSVETLQTEIGGLKTDLDNLETNLDALKADLGNVITNVEKLDTDLEGLAKAFEDYKVEVDAELEKMAQQFETTLAEVNGKFADIEKLIAGLSEVDEETQKEIASEIQAVSAQIEAVNTLLAEKVGLLLGKDDELAGKDEELANKDEELAAKDAEIEEKLGELEDLIDAIEIPQAYDDSKLVAQINEINNKIADALKTVSANYTELSSKIQALENELAALTGRVEDLENLVTSLRSVVLVPETMYNGTKAVKFHRMEGENVLKTFAYVNFHFNPSDFDLESAQYEIMAENVEFMTKAGADAPAIEIVGKPVREGDKVKFLLERAEGAGNMFALKVTLKDGNVIYSEYAAILDEATYCTATATASFEVQRLAFELPKLTTIPEIIDFVQSLGTTVEDFQTTIEAINAAICAVQNNDIVEALKQLSLIPGFTKKTATITGVGTYTVQVETLDAEEILDALKNASTVEELRKAINDLLGKAAGFGEIGSNISQALGNSGLNDLLSKYDDLKDFQLPELTLNYDKAAAQLEEYSKQLEEAKKEFAQIESELDAIVAGLDPAVRAEIAALEAEKAELEASLETAGTLEAIGIKTKIAAKDAAITAKAGADYLKVKAQLVLKQSGVAVAEGLVGTAKETLKFTENAIAEAKDRLQNIENEILGKVKDYILNNTELGQYIKELENAIGEQAWEAKKKVAQGTAELMAIDAVLADLIKNYNAANEAVVEEFSNSLFGRLAYLIQTEEAAAAFETIGLTPLYTSLKQLPDLITLIIKYYPTGIDLTNFTSFNDFGTFFSEYLTSIIPAVEVSWETDYLLAE